MKSKMYPVLSSEYSISKVHTEEGDDMLIYNTLTGVKARPNEATYELAKRCTGNMTLEEIISELSCMSGEPPEEIEKNLSKILETMEDRGMIFFVPSPLESPRPRPHEAELFRRITTIIFNITHQCNLRCEHCYNNSGAKREHELSFEEIKKMIDEFAAIGVVNMVISGGEPLLHRHLFDIIEYVRSKPMSVMVFTNGTLITKDTVQKFKESHILSVATSINGATPETDNSFRGVPGSFEKTIKAIEMLKEAEIPVRVNVCLHKGILDEFADLLRLFKEWKIAEYSVWPVTYTGRSGGPDFLITPEDYREVLKQLKKYESSEGIKNEIPSDTQKINCGIGKNSLTIRSDGTVIPCPPFPDTVSLGSIQKDSIVDIWNNSPLLNKVRRISVFENSLCKECPHINVCQGGCMAHRYRTTGELGCGEPFECVYFEVYGDYVPVKAVKQTRLSAEIR